MPQELLRDVLRTGSATSGSRRRLSLLPFSIAVHALIIAALVIIPLAADVNLPTPSSALRLMHVLPVVTPPPPPPPPGPRAPEVARTAAIPVTAPDRIAEELPPVPITSPDSPPGPAVSAGFGDAAGIPLVNIPEPPPPPPPVAQPPVRPGGVIREPRKLRDVPPDYPSHARIARVEGVVILEAVLDEQGRVDRLRVLRSVPLLDEAAMAAVRQWRYTPTLLNGVPVPVLMTITVRFTLNQ
jgi:protein TonB